MTYEHMIKDHQLLIDLAAQRKLIDAAPTLDSVAPLIQKCLDGGFTQQLTADTCGITRKTLVSILQRAEISEYKRVRDGIKHHESDYDTQNDEQIQTREVQ